MLPTLIVSIYGMNVPRPFQDTPFAFIGIAAASCVLALVSIFIFRRKQFF
jgi:magnesium transporter